MVSAGDDKLAKKFKEEVRPKPLPPESLRLADIVKIYQQENTPRKRKAEPLRSATDAKKAKTSNNILCEEEVPASKCLQPKPAHAISKPAAQAKKSRREKDESSDEEKKAHLGVKLVPMMLAASKKKESNSDDGKIVNPEKPVTAARTEESSSDDESSFEEEKAKPAAKKVQVVDLKSSSESDDDSIVEEENPKKPSDQTIQTVVLESSSDSSDDEEELAKTVGTTEPAVSTKEEIDIDAAKKVDQIEKEERPPMYIEETTQQEDALGCRLFVHGVTQVHSRLDFNSCFDKE